MQDLELPKEVKYLAKKGPGIDHLVKENCLPKRQRSFPVPRVKLMLLGMKPSRA